MSRYSCETRPKKRSRKTIAVLLSCCLFLLIISGCLLTALILVGKHILYNAPHKILIKNVVPSGKSGGTAAPLISRLPNDTKPILYNLTLLPNLENGQFKGFVNISIDVSRERKTIVLHSKNLSIDAVELISNSDWKVLEISNVNESVLDETITIIPKKSIPSGLYNLFIKFSGNMLHKLRGLYRSSYKDSSSGKDRVIATSKFEPTYARQAFPCFDEPNLKAKYKIHLLKPKKENYIALSNFPALPNPVSYDDQNEIVSFEETDIKMSTYLACFIVSDFKSTDYKFQNLNNIDVPFKVYASPEQLDKTTYAGQVGEKVMKEYVNYFEIDYPLPKLDMVAIPDFVSGAMEHWGLVTFRETALLYTPTTHSAANKQRVATVIAHELAHSWFGNLVTMNWWNDLWLNEGFASYIEYKGVAAAEPTWGMMDQFLIGDLHSVLALDATKNTHPIINVVETPDQITEVFDTISYNKGAAILRMLENTVGSDVFKEGVKNYLNRYAQGNAVSDNFFAEIQAVVGNAMNVQEFMNTYTIMSGYPVVTVEDDGDRYILKQKPFLTNSENFDEIPINTKWAIPITYRTDAGKSPELIWFQTTDDSITIEKPTDATWIKFNNEQIGYYRVNYPEPLWEQLIDNYDNFNISDRTHLLEETFSLAAAGQLNYKIPLSISSKLKNERDYVPWSVASTVLQEIISHLETSEQELAFKNYVKDLVNDTYNELLWNELSEEHHLENLAQVVILGLACAVGHEDCLTQATTKFDIWIDSPTPTELSQNLRGLIYKYGMKHASAEKWQKLFNRFVAEKDANEKLKLMNGLASVQDLGLLNKLLILAEDETNVRGQDYFTLLSYISANPVGTALIWDYVRENWPKLVDRFTLNDRYLGRLIPTITSRFATSTKYDEMMQFFDKYPEAGAGETSRKQALEAVENNIKWQTKYRKTIEDWIVAAA